MKFCTVCGAKATQPEPLSESIKPVAMPLTAPAFEKKPAPVTIPVSGRGRICPSCGAALAPEATVCTACNDRIWREKWVQG
jgi:predicted nucleic acid-binding Zn ribbon protein